MGLDRKMVSVRPIPSPKGEIFRLRFARSTLCVDHNTKEPGDWFTGYSDCRTMMHPFKYGDMYLNGDVYFFKIKVNGP